MALVMNQLRFDGTGTMTSINPVLGYKSITIAGDDFVEESAFQDITISPNNGQFVQGRDYYLELMIPQDMNYSMTFEIQLIKATGSENNYQHIKTVVLNRGGSGANVYTVVLYEGSDGVVRAAVPKNYVATATNTKNEIYYQASTKSYYLGNGGTSYTKWTKVNDSFMIASWKQSSSTNYGVFQIIFSPIESGFTHIHVKMVRTAQDYNIQRTSSTGVTEYGRKLDISKVKCTLYSLNDLLSKMMPEGGILRRIGVWSHPGLLMSINGEEIRVTANGYYELDDFTITKFGIAARAGNYEDFFTVDYTYEVGEG